MATARTIIVGDVHGCREELAELLKVLKVKDPDRVICVGDIVAKGPDSRGAIQLLRDVGADAVRGNHDAHVLRFREGGPDVRRPLKPEHQEVLDTLRPADWRWLEALPLFIRLPEHDAVVVHAGLVPGIAVEDQDPETLLTVRSITSEGAPTKRLEGGEPWARLWKGPEHVYFGHDAVRGLQRERFATGLDSGCVYGNQLTACVLPSAKLVQVPAKRAYAPPGK